MALFNNREIAFGIWLLVIVIISLTNEKIRQAGSNVLKNFFQWKILAYCFISICYFLLLLILVNKFFHLDVYLLKDAILWFIPSGIIQTANCLHVEDTNNLFKIQIKSNIKITIIIEFMVATFVFSLVSEILLVPFTVFFMLISDVVEKEATHEIIKRIFNYLMSFFGLLVIIFVIYSAIKDYNKLIGISSVMSFLLPIILMFLYFPFSYLFILYAEYELVFVRINVLFKNIKKVELGKYLKKEIFKFCLLNYDRLNAISKNKYYYWSSIENKNQVSEFLYQNKMKIKKEY